MATERITTVLPELAGRIVPAYIFVCGWCQTGTPLHHPQGFSTTQGKAEQVARQNGWAKTAKLGWVCPNCKGKKPSERPAVIPTTMMELV